MAVRTSVALGLVLLGLAGCESSDPLSAVPNPQGTAILRDKLIGQSARAVCVTKALGDKCTRETSEVFVEDVEKLADVRARWVSDKAVAVEVDSGRVARASAKSRDGMIAIRVRSPGAAELTGR